VFAKRDDLKATYRKREMKDTKPLDVKNVEENQFDDAKITYIAHEVRGMRR
jgi:hypothetical protein